MADEAMNVRGPCASCGAQLASDQRYCVECGHRVGPPLALPYALPVAGAEPPTETGSRRLRLPIPPDLVGAQLRANAVERIGLVAGTGDLMAHLALLCPIDSLSFLDLRRIQHFAQLERFDCHALAQRHTLDVLHHNVVTTIFHFAYFMDHADIGVIE